MLTKAVSSRTLCGGVEIIDLLKADEPTYSFGELQQYLRNRPKGLSLEMGKIEVHRTSLSLSLSLSLT